MIYRGARIVDKLKADLLIGMDILSPEAIDLILSQSLMTIGSCQGIRIPIDIKAREGDRLVRLQLPLQGAPFTKIMENFNRQREGTGGLLAILVAL